MSHYLIMRVDSRKAKRNLSLVRDPSLAEVQLRNLLVVCGDLRTGEEGR